MDDGETNGKINNGSEGAVNDQKQDHYKDQLFIESYPFSQCG